MGTLKGQNFRICTYDATSAKYKVIGMATTCTVTLTNNVENATHKDIVGAAAMPTTVSKSWQVSVESLDVVDAATFLSAVKAMTPFTLLWDETSTTDNQTLQNESFSRKGQAYVNDLTLTFNDRTNSTKAIQFAGSGQLESVSSSEAVSDVIAVGSYTKGQFVRLFLSSDNTTTPTEVIAAARSLALHISVSMEQSTTKDTEGEWQLQEPTELNYDISTTALVKANDTITSQVMSQTFADIEQIYEDGNPVKWQIANVSGANQRTKGSILASGSATLTQLTVNAPNRQSVDYTAQLTGYGDYTVGA